MKTLIKELLEHFPSWFYLIAAVLFLMCLVVVLWWLGIGARRFTEAIGRESRLVKLQDKIIDLEQNNEMSEGIASQLSTAFINIKGAIASLNKIRLLNNAETISQTTTFLMQRLIENLASDVKTSAGEKHRCGFWIEIEDNGELQLIVGSAGFPEGYLGNRCLDINNSVAGRAFRKRQIIVLDSVKDDQDWEPNPDSNSYYSALICIPISEWGILTIDAKKPMDQETVLIGELYGTLLEGTMNEYSRSLEINEGE